MISKSLGQILRVSGVMHVLFSLEEENVDDTVTVAAINAAIHFVEVCCQQTAYIAGRGELEKELSMLMEGTSASASASAKYTSVVSNQFLVFKDMAHKT